MQVRQSFTCSNTPSHERPALTEDYEGETRDSPIRLVPCFGYTAEPGCRLIEAGQTAPIDGWEHDIIHSRYE